ncbi:acyltransferase domain-containing protein [Micromonospora sp. NPDC048930]|uniref:acyltransferase domain-containing protein n=1 Tax=Micromonospora sp. NPDC048930 TaxID=3364261 RepID=UPI0037176688
MDHVETVMRELSLPETAREAVRRLAGAAGPATVGLPAPSRTDAVLRRLGLAEVDRREMAAARPSAERHPALWWLLTRCHAQLVAQLGRPGPVPSWPQLPPALGPTARYLYPWVFVATLPAVRRYHRGRGVPSELSWEILSALGAQMAYHRAVHGQGGLHTENWLTVHFRGAIYALGRLHIERQRIWFDAAAPGETATVGPLPGRGDHSLGLHIPAGTLPPESVDDALARARDFFPRHFPEEPYRFATCVSWLLDEQLTEYLPAESNILRFQRRFRLLPSSGADDSATMVQFLFRRPLSELGRLPRDTTLQRAVIDHIRAGRVWTFRTGWFPLQTSTWEG